MVGHSFADSIMEVAFGLVLPLVLPGQPLPASPLVDPSTPRGFAGTLYGIEWGGAVYDVVSHPQTGLSLVPSSAQA